MVNTAALFPANYLKASDFPNPRLLTMRHLEMQKLADGTDKPVLFFHEGAKGLVLNKTNATTIGSIYGEETDGWAGRPIELFSQIGDFKGTPTPGIRCRAPQQQQQGYQQQGYPQQQQGYAQPPVPPVQYQQPAPPNVQSYQQPPAQQQGQQVQRPNIDAEDIPF